MLLRGYCIMLVTDQEAATVRNSGSIDPVGPVAPPPRRSWPGKGTEELQMSKK